jgi:hypothetical protein
MSTINPLEALIREIRESERIVSKPGAVIEVRSYTIPNHIAEGIKQAIREGDRDANRLFISQWIKWIKGILGEK